MVYLRDIVEEKCRLRPACQELPGLNREKTRISPRLSESSGAQQRKNMDYAPLVGIFRGSTEKKHGFRPACRNLPGLNREKTRISPRLSETSGAQQRKNMDYAPLVGIFRGSTEKKHGLRPACRKLPGLNREKTRITPRLSGTSGAQQRKNTDYAPLVGIFRGSAEKKHGLRPACQDLPGSTEQNMDYAPLVRVFEAQQEKKHDYALLVGNFRGSTEKKCSFRPACRNLPGLNREKM